MKGNLAIAALVALSRTTGDGDSAAPQARQPVSPLGKAASLGPNPPGSATPIATAAGLREFGETVNRLALSATNGKWTGDKVYVAQVWRDFKPERGEPKPDLDTFKKRITAAARAGHILLSRADLVGAYPKDALRESQIEAGGEVYHFVETQHLR